MSDYGNDMGLRILYTKLNHNVLEWKSRTMVNSDADEGINVEELYRSVNKNRIKC